LSYSHKEVSRYEWDMFVRTSPQGSIFSTSAWCSLFDIEYHIHGVYKGDELVGGVIGFIVNGGFVSGYVLTQYQGVICKELPKYTSQMSLYNKVADVLIESLDYDGITIINHPSYYDVRPFIWAGWKPLIKYTYKIRSIKEDDLSKDLRNEIKKHNNTIKLASMKDFDKLYGETFKAKGLKRPVDKDFLMRFNEEIKPVIYSNGDSMAVIMNDWNRTYYILGASEHCNSSSALLYEVFKLYESIDLCGCNVKEIGDFKAQFGGKLVSYMGVQRV
jgi:hypothetical protein